jgi:MinD-like ATPase involved in chromosome partitioning or flagellar assembly/ActR/RegA family two-component response regulator
MADVRDRGTGRMVGVMGHKQVHVLLIEDNPAEAKLTAIALSDAKHASFKVEVCGRLDSGLARISQGGVDIVLLDLNLPDSHGFETFERALSGSPGTPIVVMSGVDDESLAIRAVSLGAQDYVMKGEMEDDSLGRTLLFAIGRHGRQSKGRKKAKVVAFVGSKGGVGTTTVALNIASAIASSKKSVIAVELRPDFGTFSGQLSHLPKRNLSDLLKLAEEKISEDEINSCLVNFAWGLRVLFSPQRIEEFQEICKEKAEVLLAHLARMADYVVIDLPDGWSKASQTAVSQCHYGAVIIDNDPVSLVSGKLVFQELKSAGASGSLLNAIVVNRSGAANGPRISDIGTKLDFAVLGYVTPAAELCLRAEQAHAPFVLVAPDAPASVAIKDMVSKLLA